MKKLEPKNIEELKSTFLIHYHDDFESLFYTKDVVLSELRALLYDNNLPINYTHDFALLFNWMAVVYHYWKDSHESDKVYQVLKHIDKVKSKNKIKRVFIEFEDNQRMEVSYNSFIDDFTNFFYGKLYNDRDLYGWIKKPDVDSNLYKKFKRGRGKPESQKETFLVLTTINFISYIEQLGSFKNEASKYYFIGKFYILAGILNHYDGNHYKSERDYVVSNIKKKVEAYKGFLK